MSRRAEITMSRPELEHFLAEERVVTCASLGPNGRPHLMPLWYAVDGLVIDTWTYGASQKVKNLERSPRATLQIEAGDTYETLRGVMLECDVEILRDPATVVAVGLAVARRYRGVPDSPEVRAEIAKRGAKRVVLRFHPTLIVSWDHRKLGAAAH